MSVYPKRILLATDGTEDSVRAARVAIALASSSGAELHLVHVGQATPSTSASAARPPLPEEPPGYAEKQAKKLLDGQLEVVRSLGGEVSGSHLRMGQHAEEVVATAVETEADLLVVGNGGPRTVRRAVATAIRRPTLGLVSDAIVRSAPCPVLVAKGDVIQQ